MSPRLGRAVVAFVAVLLIALFAARDASAEPSRLPAYRLRLDLDLSIVLVGGATASSFFVIDEVSAGTCGTNCDRSRINFIDRPAAGRYDVGWSNVGDIAVAGTMAFPLLTLVLGEGFRHGLNDGVVVAEAALLASALQVLTSSAIGRPRPRVYGDDAPLEERTDANSTRSFFSGHVANTMAVTVSTMRTFQRVGRPSLGLIVLAIGTAGSSFVGVSRVLSGGHFPTDVLVGAAAGAGIGLAIPALHDAPVRITPTAIPGGSALSVSGLFP